MRSFATLATAIVACAVAEIAIPGRAVYHSGWFNVLLVVFAILLGYACRSLLRNAIGRECASIAATTAGVLAMAVATVLSGLLAPDTRSIVAAPGSQVPLGDGATLFFPISGDEPVRVRDSWQTQPIGEWRYFGTSVLSAVPRSVVGVEAKDARGETLTITQPNGEAFLSPVLLMQAQQTIAGTSLPYDSFAVPALHRIVHAVAFSARQAAQIRGTGGEAVPEVLFEVDDESDRPLPHGIVLARNGETVNVGGLTLRPNVFDYPSVDVMAAPMFAVMLLAALSIVVGIGFGLTKRA